MKNFIALFLIILVAVGFAETVKKDSVNYYLNPVTITASKFKGAQKDIAATVSVIDQLEVKQATANSVFELVKDETPGVFLTERGIMGYGVASGAAGGISIRGVGGSPVTGVLILRDGRPDIMGMMGHPLADAYSLNGIERVEIVRGPASFLYGTNAMGGVINIVSKRQTTEGFSTNVQAGAGNFNTQRYSAQHGAKLGKFDYLVTARNQSTDGHRDFSDYDGTFYTAHLGYEISSHTSVELNTNLSKINLDDPGMITTPFEDHWYDIQRSGADLTLSHSGKLGESFFKLHGNFGEHKIYDGWHSTDRTVGLMLYHNVSLLNGNKTTMGFDIKNYGGDASDSENQSPVIDYSEHFMTEWAPYINTQQLFAKRFVASAGLRLENHDLYGTELLPKIGLVTHISPLTSVRISAAKGFRSPSIRELYVFPPKNKDLKPEEMWNYELGLTQNIFSTLQVEVVGFIQEGDNLIRMAGQYPSVQWVNSAEFKHTGYELMMRWQTTEDLRLTANWTDMDLADETRETPEQKFGFGASYNLHVVSVHASVQHIAELYGADNRESKLSDYTLVNLSANVPVWQGLAVIFSGKNLLDKEYQTVLGYPMPGRTFMADVKYSF